MPNDDDHHQHGMSSKSKLPRDDEDEEDYDEEIDELPRDDEEAENYGTDREDEGFGARAEINLIKI